MYFIPETLKRRSRGSISTVWLAGVLSERMFKKKFKQRNILSIDLLHSCQEIRGYLTSRSPNISDRFSLYLTIQLTYGVIKLIKFKWLYFKDDLKKFEKEAMPRMLNWGTPDGEPVNPIDCEEVPDVNINFSDVLPKDAHLIPEDYGLALQQMRFEEVETDFGSVSTSQLASFMMGTSLETDFIHETLRDHAASVTEEISGPVRAPNNTMTPSKRRKAEEVDTPSKRRRKTLGHTFDEIQRKSPSPDIQPLQLDVEPLPVEPERIPTPEQEALPSPPLVPEQEAPADSPPAQQIEQDTLERLADLEFDPSFQVPKQRRGKKFWDEKTVISGDGIKKNLRNDIYTVSFQDVVMNLNINRQTVDDLFNLLSKSWSKKSFHRPAGRLLANFKIMLVSSCSAHGRDSARRASVQPPAQLSDDIPLIATITTRKNNQTNQTRTNVQLQDHTNDLQPDNREDTDTAPTIDIPHLDISVPDLNNVMPDIAPEETNTGTNTTLDIATAGLTLPNEIDSNESLWSGPPKKSSQSRNLSDNIIDIDDLVSDESPLRRRTPSPCTWNQHDLQAQLEILLEENPTVSFDNLVPPDDNSPLDAVTCLHYLLGMATKKQIHLDQEEGSEILWIRRYI